MKTLFFLIMTTLCFQSVAMADSPVFYAKSFKGFSKYRSAAPTECTFSSETIDDPFEGKIVRVYLNTDNDTEINSAIDIPVSDLPLHEGYKNNRYVTIAVTYNKGILQAVGVRDAAIGPRARYKETVSIQVSPDLQTPTGRASSKTVYKDLLHPIGNVIQAIDCQF